MSDLWPFVVVGLVILFAPLLEVLPETIWHLWHDR